MAEEDATPDVVEIVRRVGAVMWNGGDFGEAASLVAPNMVYRPITTWAENEERRGIDQFRQFTEEFLEAWADDAKWRFDTIRPYGDAVIALSKFSGHARASGIEITGGVFGVFRFRDGKITHIEDFTSREDAIRAAERPG
jgi:ketosteroid isomerase-like protein